MFPELLDADEARPSRIASACKTRRAKEPGSEKSDRVLSKTLRAFFLGCGGKALSASSLGCFLAAFFFGSASSSRSVATPEGGVNSGFQACTSFARAIFWLSRSFPTAWRYLHDVLLMLCVLI
jgi:hypothetical protein